jgi:hypothetical protein
MAVTHNDATPGPGCAQTGDVLANTLEKYNFFTPGMPAPESHDTRVIRRASLAIRIAIALEWTAMLVIL